MSILIKGMKMPERCEGCLMYRHNAEYDYAYCCISSVNVLGHGNARLNNCPLVEVPTPHGRLVDCETLKDDLAVLLERNANLIDDWLAYTLDDVIDETPTIIEAEEREE